MNRKPEPDMLSQIPLDDTPAPSGSGLPGGAENDFARAFAQELARFPGAWGPYVESVVRAREWERVALALEAAGPAVRSWHDLPGCVGSVLPLLAVNGRMGDLERLAAALAPSPGESDALPTWRAWRALADGLERDHGHWPDAKALAKALFMSPGARRAAGQWTQKESQVPGGESKESVARSLLWSGVAGDEAVALWGGGAETAAHVALNLAAAKKPSIENGMVSLQMLRNPRSVETLDIKVFESALNQAQGALASEDEEWISRLKEGIAGRSAAVQAASARVLAQAWAPKAQRPGGEALAEWAIAMAKKAAQLRGEAAAEAWGEWLAAAELWMGPQVFARKAQEPWDGWATPEPEQAFGVIEACAVVEFAHPGGTLMGCALLCDALGSPGWASKALLARGVKKTAADAEWAWSALAQAQSLDPNEKMAPLSPNPSNPSQSGVPVGQAVAAALAVHEAMSIAGVVERESSLPGRKAHAPRSL